jgi:hypothetical protein
LIQQIIILIDLFSPTIPFTVARIPAKQKMLGAGGPGDREVDLMITGVVPPAISSQEIVIAVNFA